MKMRNANSKTKASIDQSDAARYIIEQSCHWSVTSGGYSRPVHIFFTWRKLFSNFVLILGAIASS